MEGERMDTRIGVSTGEIAYSYQKYSAQLELSHGRQKVRGGASQDGMSQIVTMKASYTSSSFTASFQENSDGDSYHIDSKSIEISQSKQKTGEALPDPEEARWEKSVRDTIDKYLELQEKFVSKLLAGIEGDGNSKKPFAAENVSSETVELGNLPEYWNAENTSQRIVDFATSFYGVVGAGGEEYYESIKKAIQDGFDQADTLLKDLPGGDAAAKLRKQTYMLTMEKLDEWARKNGILEPSEESETDSADERDA